MDHREQWRGKRRKVKRKGEKTGRNVIRGIEGNGLKGERKRERKGERD